MSTCVHVTKTLHSPHSSLQLPGALAWDTSTAAAVQQLCANGCAECVVPGTVTGHTTPALRDVGCASVRLRLNRELEAGSYLLALQVARFGGDSSQVILPAIAAVPGDKGPDRYGESRRGLIECLVMCRPIETPEGELLTFLHDEPLFVMFPVGHAVDVHVIHRVHDFFLGFSSGTWLKIRMEQVSRAAKQFMCEQTAAGSGDENGHSNNACVSGVLERAGLAPVNDTEPPPPDSTYKLYVFDPTNRGGAAGMSELNSLQQQDSG